MPPGREALWREFAGWFALMRQAFKGIDAHQAFEKIRSVIDEVQDITSVQLALVLKTLKKPGHFLLCGDSKVAPRNPLQSRVDNRN
ncbi:MAG TPA: hypothetical protein VJ577_19015 [Burkholderiaceae bacterium]|nr:hypothetical protein [Burkholderiaceae bacterium]